MVISHACFHGRDSSFYAVAANVHQLSPRTRSEQPGHVDFLASERSILYLPSISTIKPSLICFRQSFIIISSLVSLRYPQQKDQNINPISEQKCLPQSAKWLWPYPSRLPHCRLSLEELLVLDFCLINWLEIRTTLVAVSSSIPGPL